MSKQIVLKIKENALSTNNVNGHECAWSENFLPTTTALRIGNASRWQSHPLTNSIKVASRIGEH
jgi:hypothetical protein